VRPRPAMFAPCVRRRVAARRGVWQRVLMGVALGELARYLDGLLEPERFADYAPNGLQVEGRGEVRRLITAVSANQAAIDAAVAARADALLVHHGFFWRHDVPTIVGLRARRLAALLGAQISLLGYHLPLDAHPEVGNNVGLLAAIGATPEVPFGGTPPIGWIGTLGAPSTVASVIAACGEATGRPPLAFVHGPATVTRVAALSGGGAGYFEEAMAAGADLFVTGEPSEMAQGLAVELGGTFVAAGHHGTERFGPQRLGAHLKARFGLEVEFVDIDNPV
jgi:dinuclear metal center YbgI/SA1388 family protein